MSKTWLRNEPDGSVITGLGPTGEAAPLETAEFWRISNADGVILIAAQRAKALKFNPNHEPAGSSIGGQFASGDGGGGAGESGGGTTRKPEDYVAPGTSLDRYAREVFSAKTKDEFVAALGRDPAVVEARRLIETGKTTKQLNTDENGAYTLDRQALHLQIVDRVMAEGGGATEVGQTPRLVMLMGQPGAGKSSAVSGIVNSKEFTTLNIDDVRRFIPEYQPQAAALTQDEVADIEGMIMARLMRDRHNTIIDWTGKTAEKVLNTAGAFKRLGYRVEMYEVHVGDLEAAKRAYKRFRYDTEHRFVDPIYVLGVDHLPSTSYAAARNSNSVDRWASFDNDVPMGAKPKLVDSGERKP